MGVKGFYQLLTAFILTLTLILGSFAIPAEIYLGLPALLWFWIIGMLVYGAFVYWGAKKYDA
jgi:amino acid transporter